MGVFSRVVKTTVPLGVAAHTAYSYKDEIAVDGIYGIAAPFTQLNAFVSSASNSSTTFDSAFPRGQWNDNWDFRAPMSLVDEKKYSKEKDEEKEQMIKEATATATRTIVLIRHGQYELDKKPYALTQLGRVQAEFFSEGSRIESAFRKHIHRASPKQKKGSTEVILCHGNVIRYFICRALQFPPEGWLRMSVAHSSITVMNIHPDGNVKIMSVGDMGHLPAEKISFA